MGPRTTSADANPDDVACARPGSRSAGDDHGGAALLRSPVLRTGDRTAHLLSACDRSSEDGKWNGRPGGRGAPVPKVRSRGIYLGRFDWIQASSSGPDSQLVMSAYRGWS